MDTYFFDPVRYNLLYNCSVYTVDDILFLFVVLEILYIPCTLAMYKRLDQSAYKIMFIISLADIPYMIYISGCLGQMFWGIESSSATLLAINRCVEISNPYLGRILFDRRRTWIWLACCLAYGAILGLLNKPILFSSIYMAWFTNPHTDYLPDNIAVYHNYLHVCNNTFVFIFLTALYATFAALIWCKTRKHVSNDVHSANLIKSQRLSFLQCFILSIVHINASGLYIYMQYFSVSTILVNVAMFSWFLAHGIPPIIYLLLNKSIRNDCLRMLTRRKLKDATEIKSVRSSIPHQRILTVTHVTQNIKNP
uniref:Vomeronasal type-1 receptor n=1 Tax=Ditylenchus dipsaci TaxID=166011 RepID=A0A915CP17_9BILA